MTNAASLNSQAASTQASEKYPVSKRTKKLAEWTERINHLPEKLVSGDKFKNANALSYRSRIFASMISKWDIDTFNTFFKGRLAIPTNPMGLLLFMLFPVVIGSRAIRAHERDKTGTEIWDVLRRDFTTLTLFVFMLPPVRNAINALKQKQDGINLTHKADKRDWLPKAYSYGQLADAFDLNNASKIEGLIADGNGKGLKRAGQDTLKMYTRALNDIEGGEKVLEHYRAYVDTVSRLAEEGGRLKGTINKPRSNETVKSLSHEAFQHMQNAQSELEKVSGGLGTRAMTLGRTVLAKFSRNSKYIPSFQNSLIHYAKLKRLPSDIVAIALTAVAMGWGPVAFNNYLSRQRLEKMKVHHPEGSPQPQPEANGLGSLKNPFSKLVS